MSFSRIEHPGWHVMAPTAKLCHKLNLDPVTCFETFGAFRKLYRPAERNLSPLTYICPSSHLERLPPELIDMILKPLGASGMVALGLCSRTLWRHVTSMVRSVYRTSASDPSWAGIPLICASSYIDDLPENLHELCPEVNEPWTIDENDDRINPCDTWRKRMLQCSVEASKNNRNIYLEAFDKYITMSRIPTQLHTLLKASIDRIPYVEGTRWQLRNLTTKEYVSLDLVLENNNRDRMTLALENHRWATVDAILLWYICWTSLLGAKVVRADSSTTTLERLFQRRGPWAGHCFDIIQEKDPDPGWEDVTSIFVRYADLLMEKKQKEWSKEPVQVLKKVKSLPQTAAQRLFPKLTRKREKTKARREMVGLKRVRDALQRIYSLVR
ncbi:hypothetical protein LCI18_013463 [Fusarium solani-melongenae]|uniref:Uncharacterized protein n=1 Tax=Fusarium solani subsp. cucurbitae TaxID=2747967 RepID=A0ACD3ZR11_FUSSC|nr:hypothetical protein LCI18_013463 [Fusarium solani-melongenae]